MSNAIDGFDPSTSGLWAQHASSAPNRDVSASGIEPAWAISLKIESASTVDRTQDLQIFSLTLSQLSY